MYICIYVYMYICLYTHTYIHTYLPTYVRTYVSTYTYIYIHIHTHTYTYIHIHTHTYTYIHIHIHTHTYTYTYIHIHTHTYTYIHTDTHTYTYIHIHTHTYTYIHIHTHTYTYIHIHTYTYTYIHIYIHTHIHTYTYTYIHTYILTYIHTYICIIFIHTHTSPRTQRLSVAALRREDVLLKDLWHIPAERWGIALIHQRGTRCSMYFFLCVPLRWQYLLVSQKDNGKPKKHRTSGAGAKNTLGFCFTFFSCWRFDSFMVGEPLSHNLDTIATTSTRQHHHRWRVLNDCGSKLYALPNGWGHYTATVTIILWVLKSTNFRGTVISGTTPKSPSPISRVNMKSFGQSLAAMFLAKLEHQWAKETSGIPKNFTTQHQHISTWCQPRMA